MHKFWFSAICLFVGIIARKLALTSEGFFSFCDGIDTQNIFISSRKSSYSHALQCCQKRKSVIFLLNHFEEVDAISHTVAKYFRDTELKFWIHKDSKFVSTISNENLSFEKNQNENQTQNEEKHPNGPQEMNLKSNDKCQCILWRSIGKNKTYKIETQWANCDKQINQYVCALPSMNKWSTDKNELSAKNQLRIVNNLKPSTKAKAKTTSKIRIRKIQGNGNVRMKRGVPSLITTASIAQPSPPEVDCHLATFQNGLYVSSEKMGYKKAHSCCLSKKLQPLSYSWLLSQENWMGLTYVLYYAFHEYADREMFWAHARRVNGNIVCTAAYLVNGEELVLKETPCHAARRAICLYPYSESRVCESIQYEEHGGGSYLISDKQVTHTEAYSCCRQKNMSLVNLYTTKETLALHKTILSSGTSNDKMLNIWTGGIRKLRRNYFTWTDRQKLSLMETKDFCLAAVEIFGKKNFMLIDLGCERKLQFICIDKGLARNMSVARAGIDEDKTKHYRDNQNQNNRATTLKYNNNKHRKRMNYLKETIDNVPLNYKLNLNDFGNSLSSANAANNLANVNTTVTDAQEHNFYTKQIVDTIPTIPDAIHSIQLPIIDSNKTLAEAGGGGEAPKELSAKKLMIDRNKIQLVNQIQEDDYNYQSGSPNVVTPDKLIFNHSHNLFIPTLDISAQIQPKTIDREKNQNSAKPILQGNVNKNVSGDSTYEFSALENSWKDELKLQLLNTKNNFRTKKAIEAIEWKENLKWKAEIIDELARIFLQICPQENEKATENFKEFIHVMKNLNAIYQNTLKATAMEYFAWRIIKKHLGMCVTHSLKNCDNSTDVHLSENCVLNYKPVVPFATIYPPNERLKNNQSWMIQTDPVIDSLWWMALTAAGTCFKDNTESEISTAVIAGSDFRDIIEKDFFVPLRQKWYHGGWDLLYYENIIGDFALSRYIEIMKYCAKESFQETTKRNTTLN